MQVLTIASFLALVASCAWDSKQMPSPIFLLQNICFGHYRAASILHATLTEIM
jgi:hypothetical protein